MELDSSVAQNVVAIPSCIDPDCQSITEIALRSSDGVIFGAHVHNLERYSDGFPIAEHTTRPIGEVVQLSETSEVLSLLLRFMHHKPQPDCSELDFSILSGLAEAVEKYGVYSAMECCSLLMRQAIPDHPLGVFLYAVKHNRPTLRDRSAPFTVDIPMKTVVNALEGYPSLIVAWAQYREIWRENLTSARFTKQFENTCSAARYANCRWEPVIRKALSVILDSGSLSIESFDDAVKISRRRVGSVECSHCSGIDALRPKLHEILQGVPSIGSYL